MRGEEGHDKRAAVIVTAETLWGIRHFLTSKK
jgi:hypothetical protein